MIRTRHSVAVKMGRVFQDGLVYFSFLDHLARIPLLFRSKHQPPVIAIVSPPRCGSTLTYQVLVSRIESRHLTNLANLFYATPAFGVWLASAACRQHRSTFCSDYGFVSGLCGESEGMKFWTHWSGQGLDNNPDNLKPGKLHELYSIMQRADPRKTFIGGYIGQVFCMELLRKSFPGIIFIHVTRDLLSSAYSLFRKSEGGWFSLVPAHLRDVSFSSTHDRVVEQLFSLHSIILQNSDQGDVIPIRYERLCRDSEGIVGEIVDFGRGRGLNLNLKACDFPVFNTSIVDPDVNADTRKLLECLSVRLDQEKDNNGFFSSLMP